jgi:hypothetical protein
VGCPRLSWQPGDGVRGPPYVLSGRPTDLRYRSFLEASFGTAEDAPVALRERV